MRLLAFSPIRMASAVIIVSAAALVPVAAGIAGHPGVSHVRLVDDVTCDSGDSGSGDTITVPYTSSCTVVNPPPVTVTYTPPPPPVTPPYTPSPQDIPY